MILGVIPARGGSKGIPRKNIMPFAGKPLIYWSIKAAQESKILDRFVVSTEDREIADIAERYGAEVLKRPARLAGDKVTTIEVLRDVLNKIPEADYIMLMQPTSPIRINNLVDRVISEFKKRKNIDSAATGFMCRMWEWGTRKYNLPRQADPGYFYDDGNLYILSRKDIIKGKWCGKRRLPICVESFYHYEIDDYVEKIAAEAVLKHLPHK